MRPPDGLEPSLDPTRVGSDSPTTAPVMSDGASADGLGADGAGAFPQGAAGFTPVGMEGSPRRPIHQAIDYLTAALLDVQHIRRATEETAFSDELDEQLHRLEGTLHRLGNCLLEIRGESR